MPATIPATSADSCRTDSPPRAGSPAPLRAYAGPVRDLAGRSAVPPTGSTRLSGACDQAPFSPDQHGSPAGTRAPARATPVRSDARGSHLMRTCRWRPPEAAVRTGGSLLPGGYAAGTRWLPATGPLALVTGSSLAASRRRRSG